jgi:hypothetical protein
MRKLLLLGLLLGTGMVRAIPCGSRALVQISAGGGVIGSARVDHPAVFPKQEYTTYTTTPYRMVCPDFTATSTAHELTMTGNMQAIWTHLRSKDSEAGTFNFFFRQGYIYPEIQEEYFRAGVNASVTNGRLQIGLEGLDQIFAAEVIGARINGGVLQAVWFQGKHSQVRYGPTDVVELYAKRGEADVTYPPLVSYMRLDFKHGVLTIRDNVPFPSK